MDIYLEISFLIGVALLISLVMKILRQPLIIGYILTGVIMGPHLFDVMANAEIIEIFSHIGVALLLFIVGLNLNPKSIKEVGLVASLTGIVQVLVTSTIGFFISRMFGFGVTESLYIGIALAFSSTIIIMKLLSDKGDVQKLYGKIAIGFLIVQDFIAIFILMLVSSLGGGVSLYEFVMSSVLWGIGLFAVMFLLGVYILPGLTRFISKSNELLLLFSIAWALLLSSFFYFMGFSMEIGALLAGITLSTSHFRFEISSRLRPLRDFFLVLFFILLGYQLGFGNLGEVIIPVIVFSLIVLIGNPIIVMTIMGMLKYTKRNSFLAGLTVAQISEFSFILIALGVSVGHLSNKILTYVTLTGLITIAGSSYLIIYANKIYPFLSKYLSIFERKGKKTDEHKYHGEGKYDIIVFGYTSITADLLSSFKKIRKKFLIVEHNPETILQLAKEGVDCIYGDAGDAEFLNELNFKDAKMVVSTMSDFDTNQFLLEKIIEEDAKTITVFVSQMIDEAMELYREGASYVIMPHFLGGAHASTLIEKHKLDSSKFLKERIAHVEHLKNKKAKGHEHP